MSPDELRRMFPLERRNRLERQVKEPIERGLLTSVVVVLAVLIGVIGLAMAMMREPSSYVERRVPTPAAIDQ